MTRSSIASSSLIITLCAVYAGVALGHGILKMILNVYRGWVAQHVTRDLRKRVRALEVTVDPNPVAAERGIEISMIIAEAEPIGLFVAEALSEPLLQGGILVTVLAYMVHIDPWMTLIAAAIFIPAIRLRAADAGRDQPPHQLGHHHPPRPQREPDGSHDLAIRGRRQPAGGRIPGSIGCSP